MPLLHIQGDSFLKTKQEYTKEHSSEYEKSILTIKENIFKLETSLNELNNEITSKEEDLETKNNILTEKNNKYEKSILFCNMYYYCCINAFSKYYKYIIASPSALAFSAPAYFSTIAREKSMAQPIPRLVITLPSASTEFFVTVAPAICSSNPG